MSFIDTLKKALMITNEAERHIKKISFWKYYWKNVWHLQGFLVIGYAIGFKLPGVAIFCGIINLVAVIGTYINWRKK